MPLFLYYWNLFALHYSRLDQVETAFLRALPERVVAELVALMRNRAELVSTRQEDHNLLALAGFLTFRGINLGEDIKQSLSMKLSPWHGIRARAFHQTFVLAFFALYGLEHLFQEHRIFTHNICQRLLDASADYEIFTPALQYIRSLVETRWARVKPFSGNPGITTLEDLSPGMVLQGIVRNVTHFGAFVDVGIRQNGLVHVSRLANHFVNDPHDIVQEGDTVTVRVLDIEPERQRFSLSMTLEV